MTNRIVATPLFLVVSLYGIFLLANTMLFVLRSSSAEWWLGDAVIYNGVDQELHISAFLSFLAYWCIFFSVSCFLFLKKGRVMEKINLPFIFILLVLFFLFQIYSALEYGLGVASSTGSVQNPLFYLLIIFSFDAFYYVYAVSEKNKSRYLIATLLFAISNIIRGWAGFIIPLLLVVFLRRRSFSRKMSCVLIIFFILAIPLLLLLREYFRGGSSYFSLLQASGVSGVELYSEYFVYVLVSMLSRLDFYSNFIGISQMASFIESSNICVPIQENIIHKAFILAGLSNECTSLGSALPSFLYDFFSGRGTSFAVGSGFMALPLSSLVYYLTSYMAVLLGTGLYVATSARYLEFKCIFVFLVAFLLFQGWMYQFVYNFIGFLLAISLVRLRSVFVTSVIPKAENMERV
ncbi:oligosaccharide repeat unit polymerase [Pseudomonas sp. NyZ480]|uniref:oligosaccharide repeat unit polymerase n=1 Tax=Pseudomonas sp. NyZ480 TaxID=3035289 RepID=UPI00240916A6|nr:oligosaccharide repeat unit polymerase [Pseudomonas sp. NyZ480]WEZ89954.1 oligosaccharide repeat unit polymerase [Pseudomonas sp. NyZ480]